MTARTFLTDLTVKLAELGDITLRPMMGEYLLYLNGKYVAVIAIILCLESKINPTRN